MKRKLLQLILWIITIQIVISGGFIAYVSWDSNIKVIRHDNKLNLDYIEETFNITIENSTFINNHHFVQKMSQLKNVRVTLYTDSGIFLADSLDNTLLFQDVLEPEVEAALTKKYGETTRIDEFTKQLTFFSSRMIHTQNESYIVVLSKSIEPLRSELLLLVKHIILAVFVGIFISLSAGYRFVGRYTSPIIQLKESAMAISSGQYEYELDTSATDEVGELADAFQTMTHSIKEAVTELSEKNAHMNAVLHEMFGGVIGIDLDDDIFLLNPIAERLLDVRFDNMSLKNYMNFDIPKCITDTFIEVKEKQHEIRQKVTLTSGTVLIVQNAPIRKSDGILIGYVAVLFDITEKTRMAMLQQDFFTNVSHEVRTPLTSIQGFVETLQHYKQFSDEDMDNILNIMSYETKRLDDLICNMMEIARFENTQSEPQMQVESARHIIDLTIRSLQHVSDEKHQSIRFIHNSDVDNILTNRESFELILSNLISNAIKYTPEYGEIEVSFDTKDHTAQLQVKDNGVGISEEDQKKIFQRFYRCDPSRNSKVPGYGLGLHIAKTLGSSMGLTLRVHSKEKSGSTFILENILISQ